MTRKIVISERDSDRIFFTSDLHFYHENIIKYCDRPFKNAEEMNEKLVSNWNSKVPEDGTVFIIGDVSFSSPELTAKIINRLNGTKILVTGNHDSHLLKNPIFQKCFSSIHDLLEVSVKMEDDKVDFVLCHYAMRVWNKSHHGAIQLYGHSHGTLPPLGLQMDVGCDTNDFTPLSYDDILVKLWKDKSSLKIQ